MQPASMIMRWHRLLLSRTAVMVSLLALSACAHHSARDTSAHTVAVASDASLQLLPAGAVLRNVALTQRVEAVYAPASTAATPQSHSFIVQIEAAGDELRMAGLTPLGVQLFALQQHGTALDVDVPAYVALPFDPRFMLADMQLALAPLAALDAQLTGAKLRQAPDGSRRSLVAGDGAERLQIRYRGAFCKQGSELQIEHRERHYRIQITTLSCDAL